MGFKGSDHLHQGFHTLDQLPTGESAVVDQVGGCREVSRRLMEMGLLAGTRVEAIRKAPFGDPLEIRLRGYLLSLRLADAAAITLRPEAAAETPTPEAARGSGLSFSGASSSHVS